MLTDQLATAIATARGPQLDNLGRLTWRGLAEGLVTEADAGRLSEALEARRAAIRSLIAASASKRAGGAPRAARWQVVSPDRRRSIERRRRQACSGIVPGKLACHFTPGQIAVLTVIGREVQRAGVCAWPIDRIAAVAGVCRTVVQNALREARRLRLITVQERRRRGQPSLTNVVRIVSAEWATWLRLSGERGGRVQNFEHHGITKQKLGSAERRGRVSQPSREGVPRFERGR
jgi:hypothetical protein